MWPDVTRCDQMWQMWPGVTRCDQCDQLWPDVTKVTSCDQMWPGVTICDQKWLDVTSFEQCDQMWPIVTRCDQCDQLWPDVTNSNIYHLLLKPPTIKNQLRRRSIMWVYHLVFTNKRTLKFGHIGNWGHWFLKTTFKKYFWGRLEAVWPLFIFFRLVDIRGCAIDRKHVPSRVKPLGLSIRVGAICNFWWMMIHLKRVIQVMNYPIDRG